MADSLPWSCRRGDSSQEEREREMERERGLVGSHNTAKFRANSAKIRALYLFGIGRPSILMGNFGRTIF